MQEIEFEQLKFGCEEQIQVLKRLRERLEIEDLVDQLLKFDLRLIRLVLKDKGVLD